jgi:hypothetical protein
MADIALDTDGLADFLAQYYGEARHGAASFAPCAWLSQPAVSLINRILMDYRTDGSVSGFVVASTFAFLEIMRKWEVLIQGRIKPYQMRAFLDGPPEWFLVAAVDADLVPFYCRLPAQVQMDNGGVRSIEWTDAVHAATALSRHDPPHSRCFFQTQDTRLVRIEQLAGQCV